MANGAITSAVSVTNGVSGSLLLNGSPAVAYGLTATTNAGTYGLTIVPSLQMEGYVFSSGNVVNYAVNAKPITLTNTARTTTYDGVSSYATMASGTTFTTNGLVGSDSVQTVTQTVSGISGTPSGVAQAGSYTATPSAAVMGTGLLSNCYVRRHLRISPSVLSLVFLKSLQYRARMYCGTER